MFESLRPDHIIQGVARFYLATPFYYLAFLPPQNHWLWVESSRLPRGRAQVLALARGAARDVARRIAATAAYQRSRHERKKVEMLFAHLKRILKLDRLRLRGMSGATDEFTLAAAVQNLRRLAKFSSQGPPVTG